MHKELKNILQHVLDLRNSSFNILCIFLTFSFGIEKLSVWKAKHEKIFSNKWDVGRTLYFPKFELQAWIFDPIMGDIVFTVCRVSDRLGVLGKMRQL